jgi:lipoprotein-releasing system ATP-binding protein
MELLRVENVFKSYYLNKQEIQAVKGISFSIEAGDIIVIVGSSGSGKSTLLTLLGGLLKPSRGKVLYKQQSLYTLSNGRLSIIRNQVFGFVFQFHYLISELTARENVMLPARIARKKINETVKRAEELLEQVGMKDRMNHKPGELSGGEQQRVAVCRALMNQPEVIFADEPTGNLDIKTAEGVHDVLWNLCQKTGTSLVVVTHYEPLTQRADHVLTLNEGMVIKKRSLN